MGVSREGEIMIDVHRSGVFVSRVILDLKFGLTRSHGLSDEIDT